jgi:hypothetical protein
MTDIEIVLSIPYHLPLSGINAMAEFDGSLSRNATQIDDIFPESFPNKTDFIGPEPAYLLFVPEISGLSGAGDTGDFRVL